MKEYIVQSSVILALLIAVGLNFQIKAQIAEGSFNQRVQVGMVGALIGEIGFTLLGALLENVPLSGIPSWPDKLCTSSSTRQGEENLLTEHVLRRPFLTGGTIGAGATVSAFGILRNEGGNHAGALLLSYTGMILSMLATCEWIVATLNRMPDSPLRTFLKATAILIFPAIVSGISAAIGYQAGMHPPKEKAYIKVTQSRHNRDFGGSL